MKPATRFSCEELLSVGYSLPGDLGGPVGVPDCHVNFFDFSVLALGWPDQYDIFALAELAMNWLACIDPLDPTCGGH